MSRRKRGYLYGELGDEHTSSQDIGKVRCPNWMCSGYLYIKLEKHYDGKVEDGWQMPSILCDDCHTVWRNSMLGEKKK